MKKSNIGDFLIILLGLVSMVMVVYGTLTLEIASAETEKGCLDPLSIIECQEDARIKYWDFVSDANNSINAGKNKKNFVIICDPVGSGAFKDIYVFKNNQLIFKEESIYHGLIDFDNDILKVYCGVRNKNDPNCCPSFVKETSYKYDPTINTLKIVGTKTFTAQEFEATKIATHAD